MTDIDATLPHPDAEDAPEDVPLIEALAALEHRQWSHEIAQVLRVLTPVVAITCRCSQCAEAQKTLAGWRRQIGTDYASLTETEKDVPRMWARAALARTRTDTREVDQRAGQRLRREHEREKALDALHALVKADFSREVWGKYIGTDEGAISEPEDISEDPRIKDIARHCAEGSNTSQIIEQSFIHAFGEEGGRERLDACGYNEAVESICLEARDLKAQVAAQWTSMPMGDRFNEAARKTMPPEDRAFYLTWTPGYPCGYNITRGYGAGEYRWDGEQEADQNRITHWAPLLAAPGVTMAEGPP